MEPNKNPSHGNSEDPKDLFESLPDESLLSSILQMLPADLKFLTQSLLVSHRFAATILRLPALTIPLPPPNATYRASPDYEIRYNLFESSYASMTNTLNKFINLRSLHLLFPEDDPLMATAGYAYIKIKVEPEFYTVVFLESNLKYKMNGNPDSINIAGTGKLNLWSGMNFWHDYLIKLVRDFPMGENFKISSPNSLTEICVGGEELVRLKMLTMEEVSDFREQRLLRKLTLPEAGYILEDVFFSVRRVGRPEKMPENWNDIMGWDFGEDDDVFGEAIKLDLMSLEFNFMQQINWQMNRLNQMVQQINWPINPMGQQQVHCHRIWQQVNWQLNGMGQQPLAYPFAN